MSRRATAPAPRAGAGAEADEREGGHEEAPEWRPRPPLRGLFGVALLVAGVAAFVFSASGTGPAAIVMGGNLPVNAGAVDARDTTAHNSPTVVVDPTNAGNVVVANRIDSPSFSCALHLSADGGVRWSQAPLPVPEGEEPKCYAPDAAFGTDGTLYVSFVTLAGDGNVPHAVWLSTSADKGRTLSDPAKVLGPNAFQVRLLADPATPRRLYRTWVQAASVALYAFPEAGNPILFSRSDDGGITWQEPVRVSNPSRARVVAPILDIGPRGDLYALFLDLVDDRLDYHGGHEGKGGAPYPGPWRLVMARSRDHGATWAESVVEKALVPTERFVVFLPSFPSLAVDRRSGKIFAGFHDGRSGDADVLVWASGDGGATFGSPRRVNDTRRGDGTAQYLPRLDVAPNGRLDVVYYDRRADRRDVMNQVSLQSSFDGGRTFTGRLELADRSFDSTVGYGSERDLPDLGSRLGLESTSERALAVWTDTRAASGSNRRQDLVRALVEITAPDRASGWSGAGLRWGGVASGLAGLVLVVVAAMAARRGGAGGRGSGGGPGEEIGAGTTTDIR